MFCQLHQLGHLWMNHTYACLQLPGQNNYQNTFKKKKKKKRLLVLHKMQSIANTSNISIYIHLHATEQCTSRRVLRDIFSSNFKNIIYQITSIYIYMANKLLTITQSCLGAYLYSAGTQHRNLLKLLVTANTVMSLKNSGPHGHWAEIYKQKPLVILKKTFISII